MRNIHVFVAGLEQKCNIEFTYMHYNGFIIYWNIRKFGNKDAYNFELLKIREKMSQKSGVTYERHI